MDQEPLMMPEMKPPFIEGLNAYENFLSSIKNGICKLEELDNANRRGLITTEQYTSLLRSLVKKLEQRDGIDPLTGVFDRTFLKTQFDQFKDELNFEKEYRRLPIEAVMVVFLDINKFKMLNDTYGHLVGDKALKELTIRIRKATKRSDQIFRVGGDEFVVLLPINDNTDRSLNLIFERISKNLNDKFTVLSETGEEINIQLSMGYEVIKAGDDKTAEQVLYSADKKMYQNKAGEVN